MAQALAAIPEPLSTEQLAQRFKGKGLWKKGLPTLLQTLHALGRAQLVEDEGVRCCGGFERSRQDWE